MERRREARRMKQQEDVTEDTENDLNTRGSSEEPFQNLDGSPYSKKVQKKRGRKSKKSSPPPPPPPPSKPKAPLPPVIAAPSSTDSPDLPQPNGFVNGARLSASNTPRILRKMSEESSQNSSLLVTRLREAGADRDVADFRTRQQLQQSGFDSDITNLLNRDSDRDLLSPIEEKKRKRNTQVNIINGCFL